MVEDEGKTDTHDVLSKTACVENIHRAKDVDMTENSAAADDHILMSFEGDEEIDMEELRRQGFDFDEGEYEIVYVDASEDETDESQTQSVNLDSSNTQMNNVQMESDGTDDLPTPPRLARSFSAPPRSYYFTPFTESSAAASASASSLPSSSATSAASLYKERKARLSAPLSYTPKHRLQDTRPAQRQRCYHCAGHKYYCCGPFTNLSESVHITSADAMGADGDDYATADDARADTDDAGLSDLSFSWRKHCGYLNRHHRVKYHGDIRYRPPTPHPRSLPLSNSNTKGHAVESIDDSSTGAARWMTSLTSIDDYLYSHYHAPSKV